MGEGEVVSWALNIHGCSSDTTSIDVQIGSNGIENLSAAGIVLFPIPVKEILQVQSDLDIQEIVVVNLGGLKVAMARGTSINLSNLSAGIYVVQLKNSERMLNGSQKIIKE